MTEFDGTQREIKYTFVLSDTFAVTPSCKCHRIRQISRRRTYSTPYHAPKHATGSDALHALVVEKTHASKSVLSNPFVDVRQ